MILKKFKKYTETLLEPVSQHLNSINVKPNHITLLGLIISFLSGILYYTGEIRLAGIVLILAGICDLLDGNMARISGNTTDFGAFLDSTIDRYSDMFALFGITGLAFKKEDTTLFWLSVVAIIGSFMVSYTRARAECIIERCDVGIMERPERMVVLIIASLFNFLKVGLFIIAVFANITAIQRIIYTSKSIKERKG